VSDINAILDRHGIKRCGDSSCIFGPRGGMMTNGGCRCGHDDPGAPSRPTRLSRQLAHAVTEQAAEIARLTAELAAARAVPGDVEAAIQAFDDACDAVGMYTAGPKDLTAEIRLYKDHDDARDRLRTAIARAISDATAARGTVGGLLAAGEERESRAWSEKGKAPPGSCPFCASRISMVQRDGYFIARCSHRGCGAVGPRMRSVSRAADLFCQPPRREAQGMSCGPIVASPQRPRCSCTHEAGDSRCNVHPTCSECGASTTRPVDGCEACRGPLPKGG